MKTAKKIQLLPKARGQRDTKANNHAMIRSLQINVYKERPFYPEYTWQLSSAKILILTTIQLRWEGGNKKAQQGILCLYNCH